MSPAEWRALPWHEQRLYREGLAAEFERQLVQTSADPEVEFEYVDPDSGFGAAPAASGNLASLGLTVRKAGG